MTFMYRYGALITDKLKGCATMHINININEGRGCRLPETHTRYSVVVVGT